MGTFSEFAVPSPGADKSALVNHRSSEEGLAPVAGEDIVVVAGGTVSTDGTLVDRTFTDVSDLLYRLGLFRQGEFERRVVVQGRRARR